MQDSKLKFTAKLGISSWIIKLFCLFLATDIGFILLHLVYVYTDLTSNQIFSLDTDRGFSEIFQYIKEYWIALLLGFFAIKTRSFSYLSWSLLFFYLLLDDAAEIHERLGLWLSIQFAFTDMFNLRAVDFGELLVSGSVGLFFLISIAATYYFGDRSSREVSKYLTMLLFALAFFGVVVDMLHIAFEFSFLEPWFIIAEDGGELVVMSLIACLIFSLSLKIQQPASQKAFSKLR
jgi:hypothetical protein